MRRAAAVLLLIVVAVSVHGEKPRPGWLGIGYTYHRAPSGERFLYVRQLFIDGPAARAGLRGQDVITKINGKPLTFPDDLAVVRFLDGVREGQRVTFTVRRQNQMLDISIKAGAMPSNLLERRQRNEDLARSRSRQ